MFSFPRAPHRHHPLLPPPHTPPHPRAALPAPTIVDDEPYLLSVPSLPGPSNYAAAKRHVRLDSTPELVHSQEAGSSSMSGLGFSGVDGLGDDGMAGIKVERNVAVVDGHTARRRVDMNMAESGSVAAQPGFHTPLATYAAQMVVWLWFGNPRPPHPSLPSPLVPLSSLPSPSLAPTYSPYHPSPPTGYNSNPLGASTPASPVLSTSTPNPFDLSPSPSSPLNPLQIHPTSSFATFVSRLLQITMVSHSVTLIALLYVWRLKMRHSIRADAGTERRPFVASLILANKYLDDNTYTNKTWSELSGFTLADINNMETEFLRGLDFKLGVQQSEYIHWRNLLDGFILSRQRDPSLAHAAARFRVPTLPSPPQPILYTPAFAPAPLAPVSPLAYDSAATSAYQTRARSASPIAFSPPHYSYRAPASPDQIHRKRSAAHAFSADLPTSQASVYEHMRLPARKANFALPIPASSGVPARQEDGIGARPGSGLGRSSSLNRQIARMPEGYVASRRGSAGHVCTQAATPVVGGGGSGDLRHAAVQHNHQQHHPGWTPATQSGQTEWNALIAPGDYARADPQMVPPEHLMFYELAAEAHPGQDGAPRKAILRYQDPNAVYTYPYATPMQYQQATRQPAFGYTFPTSHLETSGYGPIAIADGSMNISPSTTYPHQQLPPQPHTYLPSDESYGAPALAEPGSFANAGPPGWAYHAQQQQQQQQQIPPLPLPSQQNGYGWAPGHAQGANRWSTGSEEMLYYDGSAYQHEWGEGGADGGGSSAMGGGWTSRSEWNSPAHGWTGRYGQ